MTGFLEDLIYVREAVNLLDQFILSDSHGWPMTSSRTHGLPPLTTGNLLLYQRRLSGLDPSILARDGGDRLLGTLDRHLIRWNAAWERKARMEYPERRRLWLGFIKDFCADPAANRASYNFKIRWRVILELLSAQWGSFGFDPDEELSRADIHLRAAGLPANFLWESDIQSAFPPEKFWYLFIVV